ncbi:hypothetical protein R1sor_004749 [Riccia sorocarpa]|uniref:Uncharacterized protein n=1 Tax=Riccia sorocarpa TaxID=122646 RepID=A0ABD3HHJ7_9MARC
MNNWKLKLLSFAGRAVTLKHMLRSVPIHLLSCLRLHRQALDAMEGMCRSFLWGKNVNGGSMIPLVAWSEITKAKSKGGLHLTSFHTSSKALRLKMSMKLIQEIEEEWVLTAEQVIKSVRWRGACAADRNSWNRQEILLLGGPKRIPHAPTVTGLLEAWNVGRQHLQLPRNAMLGREMHCYQYLRLGHMQKWWTEADMKICMQQTKRLQINTLQEWAQWLDRIWDGGVNSLEDDLAFRIGLSANLGVKDTIPIQELEWFWKPRTKRFTGWIHTSSVWKMLVSPEEMDDGGLNLKWNQTDTPQQWKKRWRRLWRSQIQSKDKMWIWKLIRQGIPSLQRAMKWEKNWTPPTGSTFIDLIDSIWRGNDIAKINLYVKMLWTIWLERNAKTYNSQELSIRTLVAAKMAKSFIEAVQSTTKEETEAHRKLLKACDDLEELYPEMAAPSDQTEEIEDTSNPETQAPILPNTISSSANMETTDNEFRDRNDDV